MNKNKNIYSGDAWLAQSVGHVTLDLEVMSSSPMYSVEPTYKK